MKSVGCSGRSWIPRPSDGSYRALGPKTIVSMYCRSYPLPWSCYLPGGLIATTFFGDGPRREGDQPRGFSGWSKSKAALDVRILAARKEIDAGAKPLPHWTVHDLRRTAATAMAEQLSVLPHVVETILNHVSGHRAGVAGVYNRARYQAEMRDALQRWTEHLVRIVRR
jgi:hypothetical protein